MTQMLRQSDSAIFTAGSEANHNALLNLAGLLREAGFNVRNKSPTEATLRVYLDLQHRYPLLNPRFTDGRLEITVLTKKSRPKLLFGEVVDAADFKIRKLDIERDGYWCHGVIEVGVDDAGEFRTGLEQLRTLRGWLLQDGSSAVDKTTRTEERAMDGSIDDEPLGIYVEGGRRIAYVNRYERDPKARQECLKIYGAKCVVCGFSAADTYNDIGREIIHVHHLIPLSEIGAEYEVDPGRDLRPLCPNCHAAVHSQVPPLTIEELKVKLRTHKSVA